MAATYAELLQKAEHETPTLVETAALGALLHAFYGGIENIFKRVAVVIDESVPSGDSWHRDLLDQVFRATENRPAVLSEALRLRLVEYLGFRHVFRGSLLINLYWERMRPLVSGFRSVLADFETQVEEFLRAGEARSS
jgi:hypothetical protein